MGDKVREAAQAVVDCWFSSGLMGLDAALNALNDALASPPQEQAPGWMPIETAKQDGPPIIVASDDGDMALAHFVVNGWVHYIAGVPMLFQPGLQFKPTKWAAAPSQEQAKGRV